MNKHIKNKEVTVIEIDGEKWLIVLNASVDGSLEAKHLASDEIWKLNNSCDHFLTGRRNSDGTYEFACSEELQEKIRAKILRGHPWKKVRL